MNTNRRETLEEMIRILDETRQMVGDQSLSKAALVLSKWRDNEPERFMFHILDGSHVVANNFETEVMARAEAEAFMTACPSIEVVEIANQTTGEIVDTLWK